MSKGYRRVQLSSEEDARPQARASARKVSPLRVVLAVVGALLLVASGAQLVELMSSMPRPTAAAALHVPAPSFAWTTIAGAVFLPIAAVLCFVAFSAARPSALRS